MKKSISEAAGDRRRVILAPTVERLGIISDIHANLPALQAVFAEANADAWLNLGDVVGYALEPNEVCALLAEHDVLSVMGNHDAYALGLITPLPENAERYRLAWTRERLTNESLRYLDGLPFGLDIEIPGSPARRIRAYHANPDDLETYLYQPADWERISVEEGELLAVGHTHIQRVESLGGGRILNPGSVGQPRDYLPGAAYAVFTRSSGDIELHRTPYDWEPYQERMAADGVDPKIVGMLSRRRDLEPKRS